MPTPSDLSRADDGFRPVRATIDRARMSRIRIAATTLALVGAGLVLAGCTGGPGDQDDFVEVLRLDDGFTENEATCIADAVFDEYGEDADALGKISGAESYEWLIGEDGVDGFDQFFPGVVADCTTVGPSPADE